MHVSDEASSIICRGLVAMNAASNLLSEVNIICTAMKRRKGKTVEEAGTPTEARRNCREGFGKLKLSQQT